MSPENLAYALTQVVHNFGAVAVLGGAAFALWPAPRLEAGRAFAWLILAAWAAQLASGGVFGLVSYHYYGETPDLSSVAMTALVVKITAAVAGVLLSARVLLRGRQWRPDAMKRTFQGLAALGAVALTAAAFLRWFS
ncbi:hypothetical protein [Thiobacillus sedimenti]|uniref:Copper resistance protein D domain-containing protein n=1 Tax=Thiobacillus sedimenti TaxID=3110231 RepID=A0ABZ1CH16_9PROT|nr:hypothetical protein [Thiobacillus sp. SCUT-2]WRS38494.1 hypothetical protein VA613_10815 [Thiobacillus sp. SCUT-2]